MSGSLHLNGMTGTDFPLYGYMAPQGNWETEASSSLVQETILASIVYGEIGLVRVELIPGASWSSSISREFVPGRCA